MLLEKQNNQRLVQIQTELEKAIQEQQTNPKQYIESDELDGLNERLRTYESEISQLQKDCLNIKSISENELEDERTKLCKLFNNVKKEKSLGTNLETYNY